MAACECRFSSDVIVSPECRDSSFGISALDYYFISGVMPESE